MELYITHFATFGLLFLFLLLLLQFVNNLKKKCAGFPFEHAIPYIIYYQFNGKITKDSPLNHVMLQKLIDVGKKYMEEGICMTFFLRPMLFVFGADAVKAFVHEKSALDKPSEYVIFEDLMGDGLITSNGERWRAHRKIINPAFNLGMLKEIVPIFNEHAMGLVKDMEKLVDKPSVDISEALKCHSFKALCEAALGLKQGQENVEQILKFAETVDSLTVMVPKRIAFPWLRLKFLWQLFPSGRKYYRDIDECNDFVDKVISEMKKHFSCNDDTDKERFGVNFCKSFTYLLLDQHFKDPTFTFKDLRDEVKTFMVAGYDTVHFSTMWCLFLLGLHPDIQEKVYDEIQSVTSDYVTYEETTKLVYLESVIMESMRLYPTVTLFARILSQDVQYRKYKVHKGTTIAFFPYLLHRDPKIYPDPEEFKPERFLNPKTRNWSNLMTFSEGSRVCIGKNFALIEMKIFLAHILRTFRITSLDRREDIRLCWTVFTTPVKPLRTKITFRNDASV